MKRIIAVLAMMILLAGIAVPASAMLTTEEKNNQYRNAILELEAYLETPNGNVESLYGIQSAFDSLGRFGQSESMYYYTLILIKIYEEAYDYELLSSLELLELDQVFMNYLKEDMKGSPLCSVANLKTYAEAREKEHSGDVLGAMVCYKNCMSYFDAKKRYQNLRESTDQQTYDEAVSRQNAGDFASAYFMFSEIIPFKDSEKRKQAIEKMLGYKPASATDNLNPVTGLKVKTVGITQITLKWNASAHAKEYEVQYKQKNSNSWITAGSTKRTEYTFSGLSSSTNYDFLVTASIDKIKASAASLSARTEAKPTATPKPTPKPTSKPTPRPTASPAPTVVPLKINEIDYSKYNDGRIVVSFSGGIPPYSVSCYHYFNAQHNAGIECCIEKRAERIATVGGWVIFDGVIPGRTYWIVVRDARGQSLWRKHTSPDEPFSKFNAYISAFSLRKKKYGANYAVAVRGVAVKHLTAAQIEKSVQKQASYSNDEDSLNNTDCYTFYYEVTAKGLKSGKYSGNNDAAVGYALILPNGDEYSHVEAWGIWSFSKKSPKKYICAGDPWSTIFQYYKKIPTGKYTFLVIMDGHTIGSKTFTIH